jgi:hypothetical protein
MNDDTKEESHKIKKLQGDEQAESPNSKATNHKFFSWARLQWAAIMAAC